MNLAKIKKITRFWGPVFIWAAVIFLFSALPAKPVSKIYWREFAVKKTAHMVEYAIFATLLYRGFRNSGVSVKKSAFTAFAIAFFYGITDEIHQSFVPGREPRVRDTIFDTIGSLLAIYLLLKVLPKVRNEKIRKIFADLQLV